MGRSRGGFVHMTSITIRRFQPDTDSALVADLAALLIEAVAGGASIGFMAGLAEGDATAFWTERTAAVTRGDCTLLLAFADGRLAGTISLMTGMPPNQRHRADVSKMIVGRDFQRRGVGAALLAAVETEALRLGRTTLVLDTISHSTAARLYERSGWQRIGEIAAYALMPDGAMAPTTVYARHLGA